MKTVAPIVFVLVAVVVFSPVAMSRVASNTVEPTATLAKQGKRAEVGVLLGCDRDQRARLRVTVSQGSTDEEERGAVAQRKRQVECTTEQTRFPVAAQARADRRLQPGAATVCVLAVSNDDARQWCKEIMLEHP